MTDNESIADTLKLYADLSEVHGLNAFKAKSYASASFRISKLPVQLADLSAEELIKTEGVGASLSGKIQEIINTGSFTELDQILEQTPEGVLAMLQIKGIGPKKVSFIWKELNILDPGELLYACHENRLAEAKGFGLKTQETIIRSIEFMMASKNCFHYARLEDYANELQQLIQKFPEVSDCSLTGEIRRKCEILVSIEILASCELLQVPAIKNRLLESGFSVKEESEDSIKLTSRERIPVHIYHCRENEFYFKLYKTTGNNEHLSSANLPFVSGKSEIELYESAGLQFIEPELREGRNEVILSKNNALPDLVKYTDLKGALHNHSTYSDGVNTLKEMAEGCRKAGYEYLGICDHSKAAFYANGLSIERVIQQQEEIDKLNSGYTDFKIFKGIESDILSDGSLDYPEEILKSFDFVVASVHSNLKMTEEKAHSRLLKAIENPYTTILGHPTGRLLLIRNGYPVNFRLIIDACAANGVIMEHNANPYRLDMDWRHIDYALEKGVMISINPDAHSIAGYHDMYYGTCAVRKGGLTKEMTFNAMGRIEIEEYFLKKRNRQISAGA